MKKEFIKTKEEPYLICKRCGIDSFTKGRMIPCPRGGCEAVEAGKIIISKELKLFKK